MATDTWVTPRRCDHPGKRRSLQFARVPRMGRDPRFVEVPFKDEQPRENRFTPGGKTRVVRSRQCGTGSAGGRLQLGVSVTLECGADIGGIRDCAPWPTTTARTEADRPQSAH